MGGPVQSVELLLDRATDDAVRGQWALLTAAGLPSQARHTGESNAPHVTLAVRTTIPDALDDALAAAVLDLPPVRLGGLLVFAHRRCVLARAVVPSAPLLALHARVHAVLDAEPACDASAPHLAPGTWTPHVTLARNLPVADLSAAVAALGPVPEVGGSVAAVRRWDASRRRTWVLGD